MSSEFLPEADHDAAKKWLTPMMVRGRGWEESEYPNEQSVVELLGQENMGKIEDRLRASLDPVVLDIGAGKAKAVADLKQKFPQIRPIAVDWSTPEGEFDPQIARVTADARALPLGDDSVDVAYSVMTLCYIPDKLKALSEVWRVVKPGGIGLVEFGSVENFEPDLQSLIEQAGLSESFQIVQGGESKGYEGPLPVVEIRKAEGASNIDWGVSYAGARPAEHQTLGALKSYFSKPVNPSDA